MLHEIDDNPDLLALRLELYNLRQYFMQPLSEEHFWKADAALKQVWAKYDAYHETTKDVAARRITG